MPTCAKRITDNARVLVRQRPGTMPAAARTAPVAARVRASARAGDLRPAQSRRCAPPAPRDAPFRGGCGGCPEAGPGAGKRRACFVGPREGQVSSTIKMSKGWR